MTKKQLIELWNSLDDDTEIEIPYVYRKENEKIKKIEEKAKRYDEALKVIKGCNHDENGFITIYPQEIFPELKVSDDERMRNGLIKLLNCIAEIEYENTIGITKEQVLEWIKKQGEQNLAWSEEDEKMLNDTIQFIETGWTDNGKSHLIPWLKSLKERCTWKPSDEQMDSITCAVRKMKESACYDSELVSLYQDLKKLMEK